jgi:hypothetical protein
MRPEKGKKESHMNVKCKAKVKVKQSRYRPRVAWMVPGIKVPRFRDNGTGWR